MEEIYHGCQGDIDLLYNLVMEEMNKHQMPGITYGWGEEIEYKRLLSKGEKAKTLLISYGNTSRFRVLGFQVATAFTVSSKIDWKSDNPNAQYLHSIKEAVFGSMAERSVIAAVKRFLDQLGYQSA